MAFNPRRTIGPTSSVDNTIPRFDGTSGRILQNSLNVSISDDGYLGVGNLTPLVHIDVSGATNLRGLAAAPPLAPANQGRIYFDTASNKFKVSENGGLFIDLVGGGGGGGANISLSNLSSTAINQSLNPGADRLLDLGTSLLRWRDIFLGPDSLNIVTTSVETGTARNWFVGVSEVFGPTQGRLVFGEGSSEYFNISPVGNVGIGVTDAAEKIHTIAGGSNIGLRIDHSSTNPVILQLQSSSTATAITSTFGGANTYKPLQLNVGGSARMTIATDGSVGINSSTPSTKLDIVVTAANDGVRLTGSGGGTTPTYYIRTPNGGYGRMIWENGAGTDQWIYYAGTDGSGNQTSWALNDAVANKDRLTIWGGSFVSQGLVINEQANDYDFRVEGTTDQNLLFVDASVNYIGIGNSSPSSILDLSGAQTWRGMSAPAVSPSGQGRIYFDSTANLFKVSENGAAYINLVGGGGGGTPGDITGAVQFNNAGAFAGDAATFFWDNSSKFLGIGTNVPTDPVHLYANTNADKIFKAENDSTGIAASAGFLAQNSAADTIWVKQYSANNTGTIFGLSLDRAAGLISNTNGFMLVGTTSLTDLAFGTNNIERMRILQGGNVGIGTVSPTAALHVVGSARITGDVIISGNATINGTTTTTNSETVQIADNHLYLNNGYTTNTAQTSGFVTNFLPTLISDTVAGAYVAGVAAVSNPEVTTSGSATFSTGDIVQFSSSTSNNGLYEVHSHVGTLLKIRGIGLTGAIEDFTQNQFTSGVSDSATITKINVSVMRAGIDGIWESAFGSITPFSFTDVGSGSGGANTSLSNLTPTSINADLIPLLDDGYSLGSNTSRWKDGYFGAETIHIGTSLTDEAYISYSTASNKMLLGLSGSDKIAVTTDGYVGVGTSSPTFNLEVVGSLGATTKSFIIDHPTKPGKKLRYGSLEGPENGVYVRGKLDNESFIDLPEYWTNLIDENTITVSLTPIGKHQKLYVSSIDGNRICIKSSSILTPILCYYTVFAERKDVSKLIVEI